MKEKTFTNFADLWLFTKVFSVKFGGVASFGMSQASYREIVFISNLRKFSPSIVPSSASKCTTRSQTASLLGQRRLYGYIDCRYVLQANTLVLGDILYRTLCMSLPEEQIYRRTGFNCENLIIANCEFF